MKDGKYREIIKWHRPKGYVLLVRPMKSNYGLAQFSRSITVDSNLDERSALFIFLHECGHIHSKHMHRKQRLPAWQAEYEADQYAIKAMRAEGVPIPRKILKEAKEVMQDYCKDAHDKGDVVDDEVLQYAYGKDWRKFR